MQRVERVGFKGLTPGFSRRQRLQAVDFRLEYLVGRLVNEGMTPMIDILLYWTGAATWVVLLCLLGRVAWEGAVGAATAADWIWWRVKLCRTHGIEIKWSRLPAVFAARWLEFTLTSAEHSWAGEFGRWQGLRDWTVHPKAPKCGKSK